MIVAGTSIISAPEPDVVIASMKRTLLDAFNKVQVER